MFLVFHQRMKPEKLQRRVRLGFRDSTPELRDCYKTGCVSGSGADGTASLGGV